MPLFPNQRPRKSRTPSWEYVKLEPGKSWRGWIAGPTVSVHCHSVGKNSKACRAEMSGGDLACAFCTEGIESICKTYVPMWSEGGIRSLVIVGERYGEMAQACDHLQPVKVTKLISRGCPLRVEPMPWTTLHPPIEPALLKPQDITPWCLMIWGDPQIREWLGRKAESDNAVSPPTTAQKRAAAEALPGNNLRRMVIDAALQKEGLPPLAPPTTGSTPPTAGETMEEIVNRLPHLARAKNGKHTSKKGQT